MLCDDDELYTGMVERMLGDLAHEVVGIATTAADGTALIEAACPDLVIVDISTDFNSDFDVVTSALAVGAAVVVFSQRADDAILSRYAVRPVVVYKPDLIELEHTVTRLAIERLREDKDKERRLQPSSPAPGPEPTGVGDARAFYASLDEAAPGDALVSIELPDVAAQAEEAADVALRVRGLLRSADRLLASVTSVRVLLPHGGDAVASLLDRLGEGGALPIGVTVRAVTILPGEIPSDAFERLKAAQPSAWPPPAD